MNAYVRHLRAYAWIIAAAMLVAVALNATPQARSMDDLGGWETLPSTCTDPMTCTPTHP